MPGSVWRCRWAQGSQRRRPAHLTSGDEIVAWVYLYRGNATKLSQIADGRWTGGVP